jgi:hypothetical protein
MRIAASIIERLRGEGRLDPAWTTAEAAAFLWELNSFHVWDDLVNGAQIAPDRYAEIITAAALSALGAPIGQPALSWPFSRLMAASVGGAVFDEVGGPFADHDGGCVGIARDQRRHDGSVGNTDVGESPHAQLVVDDGTHHACS